jgi:hypothetical protein
VEYLIGSRSDRHGTNTREEADLDDHGEVACSLVIQTKVLGEGLRAEQFESPLHKIPIQEEKAI